MKTRSRLFLALAIAVSFVMPASAANPFAGNWHLSPDDSMVAFGSVKKGSIGEVHYFKNLSGKATADGAFSVTIKLASVETHIPVRNERLIEWLFAGADSQAVLSAKVDSAKLTKLARGSSAIFPVKGQLALNGHNIPIETDMFVARLSKTKLLVTTDKMIMLSTGEAGFNSGIDKLAEVAGLPSIDRVSPVTLRLVFETK